MKYSQAKQGRIFIIRLEDGDIVHEEIENLAKKEKINAGALIILGGADKNSKIIVGPEDGRSETIVPIEAILNDVYEVAGTGTLFPDDEGNPLLHMHMAFGRDNAKCNTITGCIRSGVKVWQIMECILFELVGTDAKRIFDQTTGFKLIHLD